jgi:hypothetical protein
VQYVATEFKAMSGPEDEVRFAVNDVMEVAWEFEGYGDTFCFLVRGSGFVSRGGGGGFGPEVGEFVL